MLDYISMKTEIVQETIKNYKHAIRTARISYGLYAAVLLTTVQSIYFGLGIAFVNGIGLGIQLCCFFFVLTNNFFMVKDYEKAQETLRRLNEIEEDKIHMEAPFLQHKCDHCKHYSTLYQDHQTGSKWTKCENKNCPCFDMARTYVN